MSYEWNFAVLYKYIPQILEGGLGTLHLLGLSLALAIPIGILMAVLRLSRIPVVSQLAVAYIDFFRSSIALVLICWFYYAAPIALHVNLSPVASIALALGLQASSFTAEIIRAGLSAVPRGQWEAAKALGLPQRDCFFHIVFPQALRKVIPVFFLMIIELLKNTALAGVVAYPEMFYAAQNVADRTYRPVETMTIVGVIYFVVLFLTGRFSHWLDHRLNHYARRG